MHFAWLALQRSMRFERYQMLGSQPDMKIVAFYHIGVAVCLAEQGFVGADS